MGGVQEGNDGSLQRHQCEHLLAQRMSNTINVIGYLGRWAPTGAEVAVYEAHLEEGQLHAAAVA